MTKGRAMRRRSSASSRSGDEGPDVDIERSGAHYEALPGVPEAASTALPPPPAEQEHEHPHGVHAPAQPAAHHASPQHQHQHHASRRPLFISAMIVLAVAVALGVVYFVGPALTSRKSGTSGTPLPTTTNNNQQPARPRVSGPRSPAPAHPALGISDVNLGKYVTLTNISLDAKTKSASCIMVVHPPDMANLTIALAGSIDTDKKAGTLTGTQVGEWPIPGRVEGLKLSNATATLNIQYTNTTALHITGTGAVAAEISYGSLSAFIDLQLPLPDNKGVALEAVVKDEFKLGQLPGAEGAQGFQDIIAVNAAFVFANYTGVYEFNTDIAPAKSTKVVPGLNFVARVEMSDNEPLALVLNMGGRGDDDTKPTVAIFTGAISTKGDFNLAADIKHMYLSDDLLLNEANVSIANSAPYLQLGLDVDMPQAWFGSQDAVRFSMTGAIGAHDSIDLKGFLAGNWSATIGSETFATTGVSFALSHTVTVDAKTGKSTVANSGQLTGVVNANEDQWQLTMGYPLASVGPRKCAAFQLHGLSNIPFSRVLKDFHAPSHDGKSPQDIFPRVEARVLDELLNTSLKSIDFFFSPSCGNISLAATIQTESLGDARAGMLLDQDCNTTTGECSGPYHIDFFFAPVKPLWNITGTSLAPIDLPTFLMRNTVFVLASMARHVYLPLNFTGGEVDTTIDVLDGLNLKATFHLDASDHFRLVAALVGPNIVELDASMWLSSHGWSLAASLLANTSSPIVLDKNAKLVHANFSLGSTTGHIADIKASVGALLQFTVDYVPDTDPSRYVLFDVMGAVDKDSATLSGDAYDKDAKLAIPTPIRQLHIEELYARMAIKRDDSVKNKTVVAVLGVLRGSLAIGDAELKVELDALSTGEKFFVELDEKPALTFGKFVEFFAGEDVLGKLPFPQSVDDKIKNIWAFDSMSVTVVTSPFSLDLVGTMSLFGFTDLRVVGSIATPEAHSANKMNMLLGVELAANASFDRVLPSVTSLSTFPFASLAVVVTNYPTSVTFPGVPDPYKAEVGFNIGAALHLNGTGSKALDSISKWTGLSTAFVNAVVQDESSFSIHAGVGGDINILNRVHVTAGGFFINVKPNDVQFGLEVDANIVLTKRAQDRLYFHGDVFVATQGLGFDVAMTQDWVDPLGVTGIVIEKCALSFALSWELVPYQIGLGGGLTISGVGGAADIWLSETAEMVYGELDNIHVSQLIDGLCKGIGLPQPPTLVDTLTNLNLDQLKLYANTAPNAVVFNGQSWPPGYSITIKNLNLWDIIKGSASLSITTTPANFELTADLQPINLLGGLLVISGAKSASDPAYLYLKLGKDTMPNVNVSGGIQFFGQHLAVACVVSDKAFSFYFSLSVFDQLLRFVVQASVVGAVKSPQDFSLHAALNNELQDYIANEVPKRVQTSKGVADRELQAAIDALKQKQADLSSIEAQIADYKARDQQALDEAQQKLKDAILVLQHAQSKVDEISNSISYWEQKIRDLPWYLKWKAAGYGAIIAGLWVEKEAATGALQAAIGIVDLCRKALGHLPTPELDPRVLALETKHGVLEAAYKTAELVVEGAKRVTDGFEDMITAIARWQGKVFNIEEATLDGSMTMIMRGDLAHIHIKGSFLSKQVDITTDVDVKLVLSFVESVWKEIAHAFQLDGAKRRYAARMAAGENIRVRLPLV